MQQTHKTTQLGVEGPTTEKLVQEVQKLVGQSTTKLTALTKALNEHCEKVEQRAKWLEGESCSLCWGPIGMGLLGVELY